ncbi:MgtC/SapB family protein [Oscillospiraceae bacterium LTW-04]|nr:MgtC/SapB family protein [Oscillospiraceae bacterium MB24-C1]
MAQFDVLLDYLRQLNIVSIFVRFAFTIFCGGIIGMERGKKRHPAGLRTHLVVCIGSASVMMVSQYIALYFSANTDPARLGAQVISGIGFLGVGTIVVTGHNQVKGLTTAAGLWASACMGLAIGIGFYEGALIMCLFLYMVLEVLERLDEQYLKTSNNIKLYIEYAHTMRLSSVITHLRDKGWKTHAIEQLKTDCDCAAMLVTLSHAGKRQAHDILLEGLRALDGVCFAEEI